MGVEREGEGEKRENNMVCMSVGVALSQADIYVMKGRAEA
jgi:hypothetical protein